MTIQLRLMPLMTGVRSPGALFSSFYETPERYRLALPIQVRMRSSPSSMLASEVA